MISKSVHKKASKYWNQILEPNIGTQSGLHQVHCTQHKLDLEMTLEQSFLLSLSKNRLCPVYMFLVVGGALAYLGIIFTLSNTICMEIVVSVGSNKDKYPNWAKQQVFLAMMHQQIQESDSQSWSGPAADNILIFMISFLY